MSNPTPKEGKRYKFRDQEFWACNGLIYIEQQTDGDFKCLNRAEFAARAIGFNEVVRTKPQSLYPDEREQLRSLVINMCAAIKEAKNQGDPHDDVAAKQVARENRRVHVMLDSDGDARIPSRRPTEKKTFIMGGHEAVLLNPKKSETFKQLII